MDGLGERAREGKFTEIMHEMVEAETADEAVRLSPFMAGKVGDLHVYKTHTNEAGPPQRGNLVRTYIPELANEISRWQDASGSQRGEDKYGKDSKKA